MEKVILSFESKQFFCHLFAVKSNSHVFTMITAGFLMAPRVAIWKYMAKIVKPEVNIAKSWQYTVILKTKQKKNKAHENLQRTKSFEKAECFFAGFNRESDENYRDVILSALHQNTAKHKPWRQGNFPCRPVFILRHIMFVVVLITTRMFCSWFNTNHNFGNFR